MPLEWVFWISVAIVAYAFLGFPLAVVIAGLIRPRSWLRNDAFRPSVTLIVSAYNEDDVIEAKLENCLKLRYPPGLLAVIVASESQDNTNDVVRRFGGRGIVLKAFEGRAGKSATLARVMPGVTSEIVVFSDANAMYRPDAIEKLVRNFSDPSVGCVIGRLVLQETADTAGAAGEAVYWSYLHWFRRRMNRAPVVPGITGTIFAIRRHLYMPIALDRGDDFELSTRIAIAGYAVVHEDEAVAEEPSSQSTAQQFRRKYRLVRWNTYSSLWLTREALRKGAYMVGLQTFSQYFLRYTVPLWLIASLASSAWLSAVRPAYAVLLGLQVAFYALGLAGLAVERSGRGMPRLLSFPCYFLTVNAAAFLGVVAQTRGQVSLWQKQR